MFLCNLLSYVLYKINKNGKGKIFQIKCTKIQGILLADKILMKR